MVILRLFRTVPLQQVSICALEKLKRIDVGRYSAIHITSYIPGQLIYPSEGGIP
jgi:hypothetical protein